MGRVGCSAEIADQDSQRQAMLLSPAGGHPLGNASSALLHWVHLFPLLKKLSLFSKELTAVGHAIILFDKQST